MALSLVHLHLDFLSHLHSICGGAFVVAAKHSCGSSLSGQSQQSNPAQKYHVKVLHDNEEAFAVVVEFTVFHPLSSFPKALIN
jgi:hypothetical protein